MACVVSCDCHVMYYGTGGPAVKWSDCVREIWYIVHVTNTQREQDYFEWCQFDNSHFSSWGPNLTKVHVRMYVHVYTCTSIPNTTVLCDRDILCTIILLLQ